MYTFVGLVFVTGLGSVLGVEFSEAQESSVARVIAIVVIVDVYVIFISISITCTRFYGLIIIYFGQWYRVIVVFVLVDYFSPCYAFVVIL